MRYFSEELFQFLFILIDYIIFKIIFVSVRHFESAFNFTFRPSFASYVRPVHILELILMGFV